MSRCGRMASHNDGKNVLSHDGMQDPAN
jgi:hypothetical protein